MLDYAHLEEIKKMGDVTFFTEVIELFCEQADSRIREIRSALAKGSAEEVQRASHALKGSSLNIGAKELVPLCQQIEDKGKTNDLVNIESLLNRLEKIYEQTQAELSRLKTPQNPGS